MFRIAPRAVAEHGTTAIQALAWFFSKKRGGADCKTGKKLYIILANGHSYQRRCQHPPVAPAQLDWSSR